MARGFPSVWSVAMVVAIGVLLAVAVRLACPLACGGGRARERFEVCDPALRADCDRLECSTTGDVASATKQCAHCGPCVAPGAATCSASMRTYCTDAECRTSADTGRAECKGCEPCIAAPVATAPTAAAPVAARVTAPVAATPVAAVPPSPPVFARTGPPCQECYRHNCEDPLMLLTKTECLHCDRCAPTARFPTLFDPSDPKYARYQGCFPELQASCTERQCLTTGDVMSGRCAGCERCPVVQGAPTCSRSLKQHCMKVCETVEDLIENEDICHLCDACVPGGDEYRKMAISPFVKANSDKDCRISFGRVPGSKLCSPLPWSAVTPPPTGEPIDTPPPLPLMCRASNQRLIKCLPKSQPTNTTPSPQIQSVPTPSLGPSQTPSQTQVVPPQSPTPSQSPTCPASLVGACRKAGNECLTTGDVAAKAWCKGCEPCVSPGAVTCSANQRKFCDKNCTTDAAKASKACVTSCATC